MESASININRNTSSDKRNPDTDIINMCKNRRPNYLTVKTSKHVQTAKLSIFSVIHDYFVHVFVSKINKYHVKVYSKIRHVAANFSF